MSAGGVKHETLFKSDRLHPVHVAADGISRPHGKRIKGGEHNDN